MKKKWLAAILALVMMASLLPGAVFATDTENEPTEPVQTEEVAEQPVEDNTELPQEEPVEAPVEESPSAPPAEQPSDSPENNDNEDTQPSGEGDEDSPSDISEEVPEEDAAEPSEAPTEESDEYASDDPSSDPTEEIALMALDGDTEKKEATPVTIQVNISVDGVLQADKDGYLVFQRALTVTDMNEDRLLTFYDLIICAHEKFYPNYSEAENPGYEFSYDSDGKLIVSKFWGTETQSTYADPHVVAYAKSTAQPKAWGQGLVGTAAILQIVNNKIFSIGACTTSGSDKIAAGSFVTSNKKHNMAYVVDVYNISAERPGQLVLGFAPQATAAFNSAMDNGASANNVNNNAKFVYAKLDEETGLCALSDLVESTDFKHELVTGQSARHKLIQLDFPGLEEGKYLFTILPNEENGYGSRIAIAPCCLVEVGEKEVKASRISFTTPVYGDDETPDSNFTYTPACSLSDNGKYTLYIPGNSTEFNVTLSTEYDEKENIRWSVWTKSISAAEYTKSTGGACKKDGTSGNVDFEGQDFQIRIYDTNKVYSIYTFQVKYLPLLSGLSIESDEGTVRMKESFSPTTNEYTVQVNSFVNTLRITPTVSGTGYTIKIGEQELAAGTASEITLTGDMKTNGVSITVMRTREGYVYEENTYELVFETPAEEATLAFLEQPVSAKYVIYDGTEQELTMAGSQKADYRALKATASASDKVSYQWYVNNTESTENGTAISGAANASYYPPTTEVGTKYYYCVASNTVTSDTAASDIATVTVYPDPAPTVEWTVEIPKVDEDKLELFKWFGTQIYDGFYYEEGDTVVPLTVNASCAIEGAEIKYKWYRWTSAAIRIESDNTTNSVIPVTDEPRLIHQYNCAVTVDFLGRTWGVRNAENPLDSEHMLAYVYVDKSPVRPGAVPWSGSGTESDPWLLASQADLEALRNFVVGTEGQDDFYSFEKCFFKLTQNIELDNTWKAIGGGYGSWSGDWTKTPDNCGKLIRAFSGTFDGGGHTVTYAENTDEPLFFIVRRATIKNLKIKAPYLDNFGLISHYAVDYGEDGDYSTGCPWTVKIENVTICSGSHITKAGFIGGFASGVNTVTIRNCTVEKDVTIGKEGEDLVGSFSTQFNGIAENCVSYATLIGRNYVGGIVAVKGQSMGSCTISDCEFHGTIQASGNYVGGILASGYRSGTAPNTPAATITRCVCDGDITGVDYVGGILGAEPVLMQCWSNGIGYIQNNRFTGSITSPGKYVGGVIGYMHSLNKYTIIENNVYLGTGAGSDKGIGGVTYVDTSYPNPAQVSDVVYINTAEGTDGCPKVKNLSWKKQHNRTDDPLGADADKLCSSTGGDTSPTPGEQAAAVEALIEAIGDVTAESKTAIEAARKAYDALSSEAKALVTNYAKLTAAERKLAALDPAGETKAIGTGDTRLVLDGVTYMVDAEAASLMQTIASLRDAGGTDDEGILSAYRSYDAMSDEIKAQVFNFADLEAMCDALGVRAHRDSLSGFAAEGLPWYVGLEITAITSGADYEIVAGSIGHNALLSLWHIEFINRLTGGRFTPYDSVTLRVAAPEMSEGLEQFRVALYADGRVAYSDCAVSGGELVFAVTEGGVYGFIGGTAAATEALAVEPVEEAIAEAEAPEAEAAPEAIESVAEPEAEDGHTLLWLWIVIGVAGVAALVVVVVLKRQDRKAKHSMKR